MEKKTGARIAQKGAAFVVAFALGLNAAPMIANASVHPTNIEVVEDESRVKDQRERDVKSVTRFIGSFDIDTIRKCMELSDYLNAYDPDMYTYTDTTPGEITRLDVNGIYDEYRASLNNSDLTYGFIQNGLEQKPAIDAAVQFSTGRLSRIIKNRLSEVFFNVFAKQRLTAEPEVYLRDGEILIVAYTVNGTRVYSINGFSVPGVYETLVDLDARYRMIRRNLRGDSSEYPNGLSFNGVERHTGESVWLSIGDSDIKEVLSRGLDIACSLYDDPTISIECDDADYEPLSEGELEFLSNNGVDLNSLESFDKTYAYMTTELDSTLNMR